MGWLEDQLAQSKQNGLSTDITSDINVDTSKFMNTAPSTKTVPVAAASNGLAYNSVVDKWSPEQWQNFGSQGGTIDANNNLVFGNNNLSTGATKEPGMFDWLGSDQMKGIGTIGGLAMSGLGIWNTMNAQDQAKKQWAAENDRANKVMAMNTERYNQWKTDKNRLNSEYA